MWYVLRFYSVASLGLDSPLYTVLGSNLQLTGAMPPLPGEDRMLTV